MQNFKATIYILALTLIMGATACSPGSREKNKDTAKPTDVITDSGSPDAGKPDDGAVVIDDGKKDGDKNDDGNVIVDLPADGDGKKDDDGNPVTPVEPIDVGQVGTPGASDTPVVVAPPVVEPPPVVDNGNHDNHGAVTDGSLQVGDIIFHKSQSKQSKAIFEAAGSEWTHVGILISKNDKWYVAEAIGPVVQTPLQDFIDRGRDKEYKIFRFKHFDPKTMESKLLAAIEKQNKAYDIYFEFSDENTYCSELVYKVMLNVTGYTVGHLQHFKDLKLNGPYVKAMIKKRLTDKGRTLNVEEPIITPISQMKESSLTLVKQSLKTDAAQ